MRFQPVAVLCLTAVVALAAGAAARAQGHNPPGVNPTHYQCYRVAEQSRFKPVAVKLQDQFGTSGVKLVRPLFLCAPVAKNGEKPKDERTHLVCYEEEGGKAADKRVTTLNQFGKEALTVGGPVMLCAPSLKRVAG